MTKIAIHQPNFFPWLGYFIKMHRADTFVYLDDVEFSKKSLTRRTLLLPKNKHRHYLRVDVEPHSDYIHINQLQLRDPESWSRKATDQLKNTYSRTPFFTENHDFILSLIRAAPDFRLFSDYTIHILDRIKDHLDIDTHTLRASTLTTTEVKSARNIEIVKLLDGTHYLSGTGARKYQSDRDYDHGHIALQYIEAFPYLQRQQKNYSSLHPDLSVIDALLHVGLEGTKTIVMEYE